MSNMIYIYIYIYIYMHASPLPAGAFRALPLNVGSYTEDETVKMAYIKV